VSKKVAVSEQITRSLSATKCRPPPQTIPFTAVITGFQQRFWIAVSRNQGDWSRGSVPVARALPSATSPMSMPVQKDFSPAPVTITQTTSGSRLASAQKASSSRAIARLNALWRSGRFSVSVATRSRFSTNRVV